MKKERLLELAGLEPSRLPPLREYPDDIISMDVPLMLKMLEWARETAKTDEQLHKVVEKLISLSPAGKTLSMKDYETIINDVVNTASDPTIQHAMSDTQYKQNNMVKSVPVKVDVLNVQSGENQGA